MTEPSAEAGHSDAVQPKDKAQFKWPTWTPQLLIVVAGVLAYANSFRGEFIFDDRDVIINNFDIRQLWPPWPAMFGQQNIYRPLVGLTLAINHAISGFDVWSYHALNLAIHLLSALALFGVLRFTLVREPLVGVFGQRATLLPAVIALIWTIHPLQTQSVTYVIQRGESMMGLFYITTLYCAIRSFGPGRRQVWQILAIAACVAGMLSKQVMLTAPILVLIYDYVFVSGSFIRAVRNSKALYAGLVASWLVLAALIYFAPPSETAGFTLRTVTPFEYFKSQFGVIAHYLWLSVWPNPLVLDYAWPKARSVAEILPYAILIGAIFVATVIAVARRRAIGFLGAWFFVILSVSSSFIPLADLAFEHRMYLPLASVIAFVVLGSYWAVPRLLSLTDLNQRVRSQTAERLAMVSLTIIIPSLIFLTAERNEQYRDAVYMWRDVVTKRPANARAHNNLGMLLAERGRVEEAAEHFSLACSSDTTYAEAQNNLGLALLSLGDIEQGKRHLILAIDLKPTHADAHYNLGRAFSAEGDFENALAQFQRTLELDPRYTEAEYQSGIVLEEQGKEAEALKSYQRVIAARPDWAGALSHIAVFLATQASSEVRDINGALKLAEKAVALTQWANPVAADALARVYAEAGRFPEAIQAADRALALAVESDNGEMAEQIRARLRLYQQGRSQDQAKHSQK